MNSLASRLPATPQCLLAYAPRGPGLLCALVCYNSGADVYGWWIGCRGHETLSAYFKLEAFYSKDDTLFTATEGSDIYGGWRLVYSKSKQKLIDPIDVENEVAHKLDELQDAFVREWLWFREEEGALAEEAEYQRAELAVRHANIRFRRLNKLNKDQVVWTFRSHDFDPKVQEYLQARWPLDYGKNGA
jgi:hypothetical protein